MANWTFKSIDIMHLTKDTMLSQLTTPDIIKIVTSIARYSPTHITIVCPLDDDSEYPNIGPTAGYMAKWLSAIRAANLKVFWRGTWLDFEGIYTRSKATPTGTPSRALGVAATVLDGTDTTSYLAKTYAFIKNNPTFFAAGDAWGPMPEPENQGVGSATTDMFASYAELGQWLVDLKTVSDSAFETNLGYRRDQILTGMTSINGGTVETNQVGSTYWAQNGRVCIDHYIPVDTYSASLDAINANSGVDMYIGEWGTTGGSGAPSTDALRSADIRTVFTTFASKSYLKGVNYWQAIGGSSLATEAILNSTTYLPKTTSYPVILSFFRNGPDNIKTRFITRLGNWLWYKGSRFRFIGGNNYTLQIDGLAKSTIAATFNAARTHGVSVMRFWCFDRDHPTTSNSQGNFRYLTNTAAGPNILTNGDFESDTSGWSLDSTFTRSNLDAHAGSYSIAITAASGTYQNFTTGSGATDNTVLPNTGYTFKYWYKLSVSGFGPIVNINTQSTYGPTIASGFPGGTAGAWVQGSISFNTGNNTKIWIRIYNNGGTVSGYFDDFTLTTSGVPYLAQVESTYAHLDMVLDEARKKNIKVILTLSEGNLYFGSYDTKITYFNWSNAIYNSGLVNTENYYHFFFDPGIKTLFKQHIAALVNRINTVNGRLYRDDDTIMSWELGNEHTIKQSSGDTNVDTLQSRNILMMNAWITEMCDYIKSIDPNHLTEFSDCRQGYSRYYDPNGVGDWVWNGSYYGIDYESIAQIPSLDIVDFHSYPNQGLGSSDLRPYVKFAVNYADRANGYKNQLHDFVIKPKNWGKVVVFGEIGYAREDTGTFPGWPMYPRRYAFNNAFKEIFDYDADGICIWTLITLGGGSFSVGMNEIGTGAYWGSNENKNDSQLMHDINGLNTTLVDPGKRARAV